MKLTKTLASCAAVLALVTACGGDSAPAPAPVPPPDPTPTPTPSPVYADAAPGSSLMLGNRCEVMHPGHVQNLPGTQADEKGFLRAVTEETYLWNAEVPALNATTFPTTQAWFDALKTPLLTASGHPKDRFHFSYPTEAWEALNNGVEMGYGLTWSTTAGKLPRSWRVAMVDAGSPAALAGVRRGDALIMVDGVDFINRNEADTVARFNAALYPVKAGDRHTLTFWRNGAAFDASMAASQVTVASVQNTRVIDTPAGKVGYLTFNAHNPPAERQLYQAMNKLQAAGVADLVLDMRYNGGGLLSIASELAYMIAGPAATDGKTFLKYSTNGRLRPIRPISFIPSMTEISAEQPLPVVTPLPHLDLKRVTILTSAGTCSASEALINGLRGIDIDVTLVGGQTCGKPYAFLPISNCGTTYFMVQYKGFNHKGQSDFEDGFAPACGSADDLGRDLGDPTEGMLAQALRLQAGQACAGPMAAATATATATASRQGAGAARSTAPARPEVMTRLPMKEVAIVPAEK
ncbi:peptidase S41 family protein [Janthinobacterium sp. HH01]|uniref:S41 family peptidase n=1 Tax=Janthinobacterium sp. HH01 TaxID=1198452 RepID=UPI0002AE925E|nr:S41 family peptidase [Janthinobacterium sp. HH01]ELX12019.1 peptidase S41 family protein [Janthinobacterium sp. HH01]